MDINYYEQLENKKLFVKLVFNLIINNFEEISDYQGLIEKIKDGSIYDYYFEIIERKKNLIYIIGGKVNKTIFIEKIDNYIYINSNLLGRGFLYFSRIITNDILNLMNNLLDNKFIVKEKLLQYQSIPICNNLIKSKFRRPFNITEDILCEY